MLLVDSSTQRTAKIVVLGGCSYHEFRLFTAQMHNIKPKLSPEGIAYWKAGDKGSSILLIMGFGMSGLAWEQQFMEIAKHHQVVCYDHLGLGKSKPITDQAISMESMAQHALSLMDHMQWKSAHIVGISMGGMIAQHLTLLARERVRTLTLIATSAGGLLSLIPKLQGLIGFWKVSLAKTAEQRLIGLQSLLFPAEYRADYTKKSYQKMIAIYGYDAPKKIRLEHLKAIFKHKTVKSLHQLADVKVTIISPSQDILIHPKQSLRLHQLIPNSKLLHYHSAGHGVITQCAIKLNQELLELFAGFDAINSQ